MREGSRYAFLFNDLYAVTLCATFFSVMHFIALLCWCLREASRKEGVRKNIGQWEGQDVPMVRPSSCTVKEGIPSSRRYLPTYLHGTQPWLDRLLPRSFVKACFPAL